MKTKKTIKKKKTSSEKRTEEEFEEKMKDEKAETNFDYPVGSVSVDLMEYEKSVINLRIINSK